MAKVQHVTKAQYQKSRLDSGFAHVEDDTNGEIVTCFLGMRTGKLDAYLQKHFPDITTPDYCSSDELSGNKFYRIGDTNFYLSFTYSIATGKMDAKERSFFCAEFFLIELQGTNKIKYEFWPTITNRSVEASPTKQTSQFASQFFGNTKTEFAKEHLLAATKKLLGIMVGIKILTQEEAEAVLSAEFGIQAAGAPTPAAKQAPDKEAAK